MISVFSIYVLRKLIQTRANAIVECGYNFKNNARGLTKMSLLSVHCTLYSILEVYYHGLL